MKIRKEEKRKAEFKAYRLTPFNEKEQSQLELEPVEATRSIVEEHNAWQSESLRSNIRL